MLVFHIDFNSAAMRRETVSSLLRSAAAYGYDAVLWEVEDKIRWETCPECAHPDAFEKAEFREILEEARSLGLAPIPLLQTFGHAEYVLSHPGRRALRELPEKRDCYCASNLDVRALLKKWLHEYLELFGDGVRHFHLGGDEAYSFGKCPVCSKRGRMALYAEHLRDVAGELLEKGIRPGCWCDMLLSGDDEEAAACLPRDFVIWHWDYCHGRPGATGGKWAGKTRFLQERGYDVVFCAAAESYGDDPFLPDYEAHSQNIAAAARLVRGDGLAGLCVTSWSIRGALKAAQEPLMALGARCLGDPGLDAATEFARIVRAQIGDVSPETLFRLTRWPHGAYGFEGRGWNVYKDASVPMAGQRDYVVAENEKHTPGFPGSAIQALEVSLRGTEEAAAALRGASRRTALGDLLLRGASLRARLLKAVLDSIAGRGRVSVPFLETAAYYAEEQTDGSAFHFARIVWAVLDARYADPLDPTRFFHPR